MLKMEFYKWVSTLLLWNYFALAPVYLSSYLPTLILHIQHPGCSIYIFLQDEYALRLRSGDGFFFGVSRNDTKTKIFSDDAGKTYDLSGVNWYQRHPKTTAGYFYVSFWYKGAYSSADRIFTVPNPGNVYCVPDE